MQNIQSEIILEFAKELMEILNTLEKEYEGKIAGNRDAFKKEILKKATELTEELYENYKVRLGLKKEGKNIVFENNNRKVRIPRDLFEKNKFFEIKKRIENQIFLIEISGTSWESFCFNFIRNFDFENENLYAINKNILEKIRFYLIFKSKYPDYYFESELPTDLKKSKYFPYYASWRKNNSFYYNYLKYIEPDKDLFTKHIWINLIPNYKTWNLNLICLEKDDFKYDQDFTSINSFPIQVFEDRSGQPEVLLFLIPKENHDSKFKNRIVNRFSIMYNLNNINSGRASKRNIYPITNSLFESYISFLDEVNGNSLTEDFKTPTFEINFEFLNKNNNDLQNPYLSQEIVNKFNLQYEKYQNYFNENLFSKDKLIYNQFNNLFKLKYTFPEFDLKNTFLLVIEKKNNIKFKRFLSFIKTWSIQTYIFETKNKIIINGILLPKFDSNTENIFIEEFFNNLNINSKFLIEKEHFSKSSFSLFRLPLSNQYDQESKCWNLNAQNYPISIDEKENIILSQIEIERKKKY